MLQCVLQCTKTAGASHQCSLEMTSPDKCSSDSSPVLWPHLGLLTHASPPRHSLRTRAWLWLRALNSAILQVYAGTTWKGDEVRGQAQVMQPHSSSDFERCDALFQCKKKRSLLIFQRKMLCPMYHVLGYLGGKKQARHKGQLKQRSQEEEEGYFTLLCWVVNQRRSIAAEDIKRRSL